MKIRPTLRFLVFSSVFALAISSFVLVNFDNLANVNGLGYDINKSEMSKEQTSTPDMQVVKVVLEKIMNKMVKFN